MKIIFIITYTIWFLSELIINRRLHSNKKDKQHVDKGSLYLIWIIIFICNFTAVFVSFRFYDPILKDPNIRYFGLLLIYLGISLRLVIIKTLGLFFTVDVTIKENHQLKKDGFYKYIRHPSYSASLISFIGLGFSLNNVISLILIFVLILTAFTIRIKVEEKALIEYFGSEYLDYKKHTKKIIPFVY